MVSVYKVVLMGVHTGTMAPDSSPGVTYVIAEDPTSAYNAVLELYSNDFSLGVSDDLALASATVVASEMMLNKTPKGLYKCVVALNKDKLTLPETAEECDEQIEEFITEVLDEAFPMEDDELDPLERAVMD